jgi:hypothetical protein
LPNFSTRLGTRNEVVPSSGWTAEELCNKAITERTAEQAYRDEAAAWAVDAVRYTEGVHSN